MSGKTVKYVKTKKYLDKMLKQPINKTMQAGVGPGTQYSLDRIHQRVIKVILLILMCININFVTFRNFFNHLKKNTYWEKIYFYYLRHSNFSRLKAFQSCL